MDREKPPVVDAEFEVIDPPAEPPLRWWQGWRLNFDWRVFALIAATSAAAFIGRLTEH